MVTLSGIEDGIVKRLRDDERVAFKDSSIIIGSNERAEGSPLLASGGIVVMYAGSVKSRDAVNGRPVERSAAFLVMIGRKISGGKADRLTKDIEAVVDAITELPIDGVLLEWREDRFALMNNSVAWHDVKFTATLRTQQ